MFHIIKPDPNKPFKIGRKESNDLRFGDLFVSREHAIIEKKEKIWYIKSLTKNSVTKINGNDITNSKLEDGDIIVIGVRRLQVNLNNEELSLLILDNKEKSYNIKLSNQWQNIDIPNLKVFKAKIDDNNCALIHFLKKISIKDGERIRISNYDVFYKDETLIISKRICGFNVSVKNLNVFANKKCLLEDINFELPAGEILTIIGRSGQGKSTLLRLLEGLYKKNKEGHVYIGDLDYRRKEIRERISFMSQEPNLRKELTVKESILHEALIAMDKNELKENAQEQFEKFTELFGLNERKNNKIKTLSGGELRRTALAKELMSNPGLIILDEPLSGLDPYNSQILCTHLKQLAFLGHTIILTTHSYEALKIANKVLVLHKGNEGYYGSPEGAYHYFKTNQPEEILSSLNDDTTLHWKQSNESRCIEFENEYKQIIFSKTKHKCIFLHEIILILKQWFRDKGKIAALFIQPIIIGFLFSQIFSQTTSLWTLSFALILCANWFALSFSIREIVQEKEILRSEFRKGLSITSFLLSKILLPSLASFFQIFIVYAFVAIKMSIHLDIKILTIVFACTILPAIAIGLLVSSLSKNSGQANAFLPLLIIPQVALAGALIPIDQMEPIGKVISLFIWSRYNHSSLLNLLLERPDNAINIIYSLLIALSLYIITAIILFLSKKAK